ncbi:Importin-5 [Carex littledalei]|uniref:Importin-5 n=1 Tax=Carex littledalei TaxID=544730 RepID=A0A833VQS6_9POAL|nr:Importin-5 [Carex littledalei]
MEVDAETDTNTLFTNLLNIIGYYSADSNLRFDAASKLHHLLLHHAAKLWPRLNPELQSRLKADLIENNFVNEEETRSVLEQLRGAVIALGSYLLPDNSWPDLKVTMFCAIVSASPGVRESGLFIFSHLAHLIEWSLLPRPSTLYSIIRSSLDSKLSSVDVPYVRNAALLAAVSLIHNVPPSEDYQMFQDLLHYMIPVLLEAVITRNQQEFAKEVVKRLTHLIKPKFIGPCLPKVVEAMLHITEFDEVNHELRCAAVNLVVTLAKTREMEPVMVEQLVPFLGRFVAILLEMLSDSDWQKRHTALFFLKEIAKGYFGVMKENMEQFVNMMVESFKDTHPRVQGAALIAMRELLVDLKPDLEAQYHDRIFPALLQAINTFNGPRRVYLQVEATRSAWQFMRWCSKDILKNYLNDILDTSYTMIRTGNKVVQDHALLTLGSLASFLEDILESKYKDIMLQLKTFLKDEISKADTDRMLCAKLMQCISTVGTVVGKGHFRNDAKEVMEELMSLPMEADDPATGYLLQACMRLLECLGRDFLPYMELVIPPLLQSAQLDSQLILSSTNIDNTEVKTGKGAGEKVLDEKASACNMLCCYAEELKEDFYPWIDQVAPLLLPFLKIKFHKEVRKAAISAMSKLLRSVRLVVEKEKPCMEDKQFCAKIIPNSLIEAMHEEDDKELCCEMVKSLVDCIQV